MNGTAPPCIVNFSKKTGEGFFQQGKIKFPINPHNLSETVYTVDSLPKDTWRTIARQNGLSIQPFSTKLLRPIIMGFVQNAWYAYIKGAVPESCTLNQIARLSRYEKDLEWEAKNAAPAPKTTSDGTPVVRKARVAALYELVPSKFTKKTELRPQEKVLFDHMKKLKEPIAAADLTAALAGEFKTKQPTARIVAFYLARWKKEGRVKVSE